MEKGINNKILFTKPDGISVVVCTYNGISRLEATLQSIFNQKFDVEIAWEVIIIDNASSDGTKEFCIALINKENFTGSFRVLTESKPGLNNARLKGLEESIYNWILFCDDDNHLFENYLEIGFGILSKNESIGVLGGMGLPVFESQKPEWFDQYQHSFAVGKQSHSNGKIASNNPEVYGAGCFFFKPALQKVFNTGFLTIMSDRKGNSLSSGGDVEWCYLIHLLKYEIWFSDELKFYHHMPAARLTWEYYIKLKAGIASGDPLLFPYAFIFKKENASLFFYIIQYLQKLITFLLLYFLYLIKIIFRVKNMTNRTVQLGYIIIKAKAISYSKRGLTSFKHYKALKLLQNKFKLKSN